jgi:hypothetical protein
VCIAKQVNKIPYPLYSMINFLKSKIPSTLQTSSPKRRSHHSMRSFNTWSFCVFAFLLLLVFFSFFLRLPPIQNLMWSKSGYTTCLPTQYNKKEILFGFVFFMFRGYFKVIVIHILSRGIILYMMHNLFCDLFVIIG